MSTPRPPYTVEELENTPYTGHDVVPPKLRFVFVLWENEQYDGSKVLAVYAIEKSANDAIADSPYSSVERVPYYEH